MKKLSLVTLLVMLCVALVRCAPKESRVYIVSLVSGQDIRIIRLEIKYEPVRSRIDGRALLGASWVSLDRWDEGRAWAQVEFDRPISGPVDIVLLWGAVSMRLEDGAQFFDSDGRAVDGKLRLEEKR